MLTPSERAVVIARLRTWPKQNMIDWFSNGDDYRDVEFTKGDIRLG